MSSEFTDEVVKPTSGGDEFLPAIALMALRRHIMSEIVKYHRYLQADPAHALYWRRCRFEGFRYLRFVDAFMNAAGVELDQSADGEYLDAFIMKALT